MASKYISSLLLKLDLTVIFCLLNKSKWHDLVLAQVVDVDIKTRFNI